LTRQGIPNDDRVHKDGAHAMTALNAELRESRRRMISGTCLRNAWYVAAWSDDLADGQLLGRTILKQRIVFYP
jgi:phenylpropionate dioxygenase-like ring-hydroxylating dioxygenase large terminal subunit